jgi:DNA-directed RNA polymerase specialized sigma24 family protein
MESEQAAEVASFYAEHPDLDDRSFERQQHERRWVGDRNLTTYPVDPHALNDAGTVFRTMFPPSDQRVAGQDEDLVIAVFQQMRPSDVSILQRRHMEQMTLDAIAAEEGVTRQAIIKRLRTAEKNLREALDGNR